MHTSKSDTFNIGALKREACDYCRGAAMIELDHDDLLVPGTLKKVAAAIADGAGFVYSDVATFHDETLQSLGYSTQFGWEHAQLRVYENVFTVTKCFPLTPRMLCEVHYAPDHVRCWSRSAYYNAGGHNPEMSVGDDHDLICRTYLTGAKFQHIGCCGYLYRFHANNTVKLREAAIKAQQAENRRAYLTPLIREWCRREKLREIDLLNELKEDESQRKAWRPSSEKVRLPYKNDSVGYLIASDILQFLPSMRIAEFFNEAYRVLQPGGYLTIAVPDVSGPYAMQNPAHRSYWNRNTFLHVSRREFAKQLPGVRCRFDYIQHSLFYPDKAYESFGMSMLKADLCALKGQHHPGPMRI